MTKRKLRTITGDVVQSPAITHDPYGRASFIPYITKGIPSFQLYIVYTDWKLELQG
jgi:hypothetical protein